MSLHFLDLPDDVLLVVLLHLVNFPDIRSMKNVSDPTLRVDLNHCHNFFVDLQAHFMVDLQRWCFARTGP